MSSIYYSSVNIDLTFKYEGNNHVLFLSLDGVYAKRLAFYLMNPIKNEKAHELFYLNCKSAQELPENYILDFKTLDNTELIILSLHCPDKSIIKYISSSPNFYYFLDKTEFKE